MKKLVYIDLQKGFFEGKVVYDRLKSTEGQNFINDFEKIYRFYDISNTFHYSFWFNKKNLFEDNQKDILKYDKEFTKKFGWYGKIGNGIIPEDVLNNITDNFKIEDSITLVGGYRNKCLLEMMNTYQNLGYKDIKIDNRYIY